MRMSLPEISNPSMVDSTIALGSVAPIASLLRRMTFDGGLGQRKPPQARRVRAPAGAQVPSSSRIVLRASGIAIY
jgi:hypothetical protein